MHYLLLVASSVDLSPLPDIGVGNDSFITDALTFVIRLVAALCLLFVIIGGLRYILSQGDPQGVTKAKSTIMYALIGLVVTIFAQVIVSLVAGAIG
jgi:hypothetical protein